MSALGFTTPATFVPSSYDSNLPMKFFPDLFREKQILDCLLPYVTILDVLCLRHIKSIKPFIDASDKAQEKLFFKPVLPDIELQVNPLIFSPANYTIENIQFYEINGAYKIYIITQGNLKALLETSHSSIKKAVLTCPSQTELDVDFSPHDPKYLETVRRVRVVNVNGVTYGDLLREAAKMIKQRRGRTASKVVMEVRFPVGQKLRLGEHEEVIQALSRSELEDLGVSSRRILHPKARLPRPVDTNGGSQDDNDDAEEDRREPWPLNEYSEEQPLASDAGQSLTDKELDRGADAHVVREALRQGQDRDDDVFMRGSIQEGEQSDNEEL